MLILSWVIASGCTSFLPAACVAQNGRQCSGTCGYQGYNYVWCWTQGGGWDYCDEACNGPPITPGLYAFDFMDKNVPCLLSIRYCSHVMVLTLQYAMLTPIVPDCCA